MSEDVFSDSAQVTDDIMCKMVAVIYSAHEEGVVGAYRSLVEATDTSIVTTSASEEKLLLISSQMARLFSRTIDVIARDRGVSSEVILHQLALSAMS